MPTPAPTPRPSPTAAPCIGVECIADAPDAFTLTTWEPGETVDSPFGLFFLNVATGRTEGYRLLEPGAGAGYEPGPTGRWVAATASRFEGRVTLLYDRESGASRQWPTDRLALVALSREHLLFEDRDLPGSYTLLNATLDVEARFSLEVGDATDPDGRRALISPDGRSVALRLRGEEFGESVHIVNVETGEPRLVLPIVGRENRWSLVELEPLRGGIGLEVRTTYYPHDRDREPPWVEESRLFSWEGVDISPASCPGRLSPDGRYVARQQGSPIWVKHVIPRPAPEQPWASVVIAAAASCEPVLRVRSAFMSKIFWEGAWLATSEGFVVGVRARPGAEGEDYVVVQLHPRPELIYLPRPESSGASAPVPAPAGDGRYFAYDFSGIYDAQSDRWIRPPFGGSPASGPFSWDRDGDEMRYTFGYWGEGGGGWLLLQPKLELPPFSDQDALRVAGPDPCHVLRIPESPQECLPVGTRVVFAGSGRDAVIDVHNSPSVRVRTEAGVVGWMSIDHLAWY